MDNVAFENTNNTFRVVRKHYCSIKNIKNIEHFCKILSKKHSVLIGRKIKSI